MTESLFKSAAKAQEGHCELPPSMSMSNATKYKSEPEHSNSGHQPVQGRSEARVDIRIEVLPIL